MNIRTITLLALSLVPLGRTARTEPYAYSPSMLTFNGVAQELAVFPLSGKAFGLPLPAALDVLAFGPEGNALYARHLGDMAAVAGEPEPGLVKIEFNPMRVSAVRGSATLSRYYAVAVSRLQDRLILSGHLVGTPRSSCGIFELQLATGSVRPVVESRACDPVTDPPYAHWEYISVSPDGLRAVALRNHRLELINLSDGEVSVVGGGAYLMGAWSPDGRWLAAVKSKADDTSLLNARTLGEGRPIGGTDLQWSPDSRYLLARERSLLCGLGETGTFEVVDVALGKRSEVQSSRCLINRARTGWVSSAIAPS